MKNKAISLFFSAVAGGLAFAADTTDYSSYVRFVRVETHEKEYGFGRNAAWSDSDAPSSGKKYYVPSDKVIASMYSGSDPLTFAGGELAIAGGFLHARTASKTTVVPVLAFCDGGYFTFKADGVNAGRGDFVSSCCIIRSSVEPAQFRFPTETAKSSRPKLLLDVHGEADAEFAFVNTGDGTSAIGFNFSGALTNYSGTVTIANGACPQLSLAENVVPATLKVRDGGILDMSLMPAGLTVGTLAWEDGGILSFPVATAGAAKIVVTNALAASGSPRLRITGHTVGAGTPPVYSIMTLAGPAAENVPELSCIAGMPVAGSLPRWQVVVTDNADGTKTVSVTHKEIVTLVKEYSSTETKYSALYEGNESYWSNEKFPDSGYDYYITLDMLWYSSGPVSFKGDSLTIAGGKTLRCARTGTVTVSDLNLCAGSVWMFLGAKASSLNGKITIWPGASPAKISGYNENTLTVNAPIAGTGDLDLTMRTGVLKPGITYSLAGDNSEFSGKIRIVTPVYAGTASYPAVPDVDNGYYTKVRIKDGNSLGGAYAGSDGWRAVTLEGKSRLIVDNDVTLDESTRGFFVSGTGYVQVAEGATLALECPFAVGGELVKLGTGKMSLGGPISFADGDSVVAPAQGMNRLSVSQGSLEVASTNSCNGLAISFAEGTVLELDVSDEAVAEYGLYNVAWDAPIGLAEGMDALSVKFNLPSGFDVSVSHRLGVCTLNPTAAAAFTPRSFSVARIPKVSASVVREENRDEDGNLVSVTFVCELAPKGFVVIVK